MSVHYAWYSHGKLHIPLVHEALVCDLTGLYSTRCYIHCKHADHSTKYCYTMHCPVGMFEVKRHHSMDLSHGDEVINKSECKKMNHTLLMKLARRYVS